MSVSGRLVLVGGGAFSRELLCWIVHIRSSQPLPDRIGYLDRDPTLASNPQYKVDYLGDVDDFAPSADDMLIMAIADPAGKQQTAEALRGRGGRFISLIHPSAVLASTAQVGLGSVICPFALVSADARVGELVTINTLSSVGHDVKVGHYVTLSSHVDLMGAVTVEDSVFFGSGSRVLPKVAIKTGAKVGAGSVVGRTVKPGATVYTPLARRL